MVLAIGQLKAAYWFGKARTPVGRMIIQLCLCAPITVMTELTALLLPRDDRFYCGLAVEATATN
jgi:hypothetical protein